MHPAVKHFNPCSSLGAKATHTPIQPHDHKQVSCRKKFQTPKRVWFPFIYRVPGSTNQLLDGELTDAASRIKIPPEGTKKGINVLHQLTARYQLLWSRTPLWSSGQSSWLHNGYVLCFLWGTNWIYICYAEESRPILWSSGQSSWLHNGDVLFPVRYELNLYMLCRRK
jgi:hypothetical protein